MPGDVTSRLHCPHKDLDDISRQMTSSLNRQLSERQNADSQQSMYLDLSVNTGSEESNVETISLIFSNAERRAQWEEAFTEVKQKMGEGLEFITESVSAIIRVKSKLDFNQLLAK